LQTTNRNALLVRFCEQYSPSYQLEICSDSEQCFFGNYPTLSTLKAEHGKNAPLAWLVPQLTNLSVYCGCKDKLTKEQYKECAFVIATEFYYLKVSELMLFFHRFKTGRYGRFYGAVDPLVITSALRDFIRERNDVIFLHDQQERERQLAESRKGCVTREEYERLKKEKQQ
jgi:hypothetical protein